MLSLVFCLHFILSFNLRWKSASSCFLLVYTRDFVTITFKEKETWPRHWQPDSMLSLLLFIQGCVQNLSKGKLTKLVDKKLCRASGSGHITEITHVNRWATHLLLIKITQTNIIKMSSPWEICGQDPIVEYEDSAHLAKREVSERGNQSISVMRTPINSVLKFRKTLLRSVWACWTYRFPRT